MASPSNQSKKKGTQPQIDRFKEAARSLGCNESEAQFDEKLKEIAKHKPEEKSDHSDTSKG